MSALFLLAACSSNENRAINEDVAAFVETNEKIALFGSINAKEILNKADYKNIDKAGKLIDKELKTIEQSFGVQLTAAIEKFKLDHADDGFAVPWVWESILEKFRNAEISLLSSNNFAEGGNSIFIDPNKP